VLEVQTQVCLNLALRHYVAIGDGGAAIARPFSPVGSGPCRNGSQFSIMTLRPYVNKHQNQVSGKYTWQKQKCIQNIN
jgi:hypothetical protein